MTLEDFLGDTGSTTSFFKQLPFEYSLKVIASKEVNGYFKRIVTISLDNEVVLVGVSKVAISHQLFYNILTNSNQEPIGLQLFAPNSPIRRKIIAIEPIASLTISNPKLKRILVDNGYVIDNIIYKRRSVFSFEQQYMYLDEYLTDNLAKFIQ